ncbi:hypothetical protein [Lacticaseibacillus sharpeae]|uniref:Uncharacterized protein n=1 Tax=Lacticaseibacillus sharpeae JCM 1186 = DSM 20505 TaxID=1291052 RepID=A0A0R1ZXR3_9LACO|nr:hypothetical protein [Lacticaseibacillus sharpeae]KRM56665.1 hypothetical protein FC18_GL001798 [Lacticaseibacillus sharpeae JCM 1186 = DSM 20505]
MEKLRKRIYLSEEKWAALDDIGAELGLGNATEVVDYLIGEHNNSGELASARKMNVRLGQVDKNVQVLVQLANGLLTNYGLDALPLSQNFENPSLTESRKIVDAQIHTAQVVKATNEMRRHRKVSDD